MQYCEMAELDYYYNRIDCKELSERGLLRGSQGA